MLQEDVDQWLPGADRNRDQRVNANGYGVSFWGDRIFLELAGGGDGCTTF